MSRRAFSFVAVCAFLIGTAQSCGPTPATPIAGITIDSISGLSTTIQKLNEMPRQVTTRVVFDEVPASDYTTALNQLDPVTPIMGELLDSAYVKQISTAGYITRTKSYLATLGDRVDIWEIGNEANGNWLGPYSSVAAKIDGAFGVIDGAGRTTALTLYYNPNGVDGPGELTPLEFTDRYVTARMKAGLDYVWLSYYETQFNNYRPSPAVLTTLFEQLHARYPNAQLGFGEIGLPHKVSNATLTQANGIMAYYYAVDPGLPYYVTGCFWWYGKQDVLSSGAPLNSQFKTAIQTMP